MSEPITDQKNAEELAYLEKPARDREVALKKQTETGLTQEQYDNTEVMNGLEEKYPKAFEVKIEIGILEI